MDLLETKYVPLVRIHAVKERFLPYGKDEISSPERVVEMVSRILEEADREYMLAISVDSKSKPVGVEIVSIGTLNAALIQPRELFKHAILSNAAAIIMLHNHPSGNPEPSKEDINITKRMRCVGEILGIELLDHIIVGDDGKFVSMSRRCEWNKSEAA